MPAAEWIAAVQASVPQPEGAYSNSSVYLTIALVAAVVGLVVLIFIRTSSGRASKR